MPASAVRRLGLSDIIGEAGYLKYVEEQKPNSTGADMDNLNKVLGGTYARH